MAISNNIFGQVPEIDLSKLDPETGLDKDPGFGALNATMEVEYNDDGSVKAYGNSKPEADAPGHEDELSDTQLFDAVVALSPDQIKELLRRINPSGSIAAPSANDGGVISRRITHEFLKELAGGPKVTVTNTDGDNDATVKVE